MGKVFYILVIAVGSLALFLNGAELALACPDDLVCGNFTDSDKIYDCEYITDQDFDDDEEQELLCILWEQEYGYDAWQSKEYDLDVDLSMDINEIDNSRFILASKILIFGLFNYFAFSLTKLSFLVKWLSI